MVLSVCVVLVVDVSCQQQGQQTEDNRVNGQQQQQQQQPCSPFQGCIQSPRLNFNPIDKFRSASRTFASAAKYLKDAIAYKKKLFSYFWIIFSEIRWTSKCRRSEQSTESRTPSLTSSRPSFSWRLTQSEEFKVCSMQKQLQSEWK